MALLSTGLAIVAGGALSLIAFGPGLGNQLRNVLNSLFHGIKPDMASLINGYLKGNITQETFEENASVLGYSKEDALSYVKYSQLIYTLEDIITLFYRYQGETYESQTIDNEWLKNAFTKIGIDPSYTDSILEAKRPIPGIQDIITFSTREVYSPEAVKLGRLMDEIPNEYLVQAKKRGLSESDAKSYWAAHWNVPSVNQAFEMYHRLDESDNPDLRFGDKELRTYFDVADIAPGYRDRLTQIAYNPLGRVDIRRMYRFGIFGNAQEAKPILLRLYKDLGYSPENAAFQVDFTIASTENADKDITRTQVLAFWRSGALGDDRDAKAKEMLVSLGYSPELADLMIKQESIKEVTADEQEEINKLITKYVNGSIKTNDQLSIELHRIPLSNKDVLKYTKQAEREREKGEKRLTRSEADRLARIGELDFDEYQEILKSRGYIETDIEKLWSLVDRPEDKDQDEPTKADIIKFYVKGLIDDNEFINRMKHLGFTLLDIGLYAEANEKPLPPSLLKQ
jgi:hypothetical protein